MTDACTCSQRITATPRYDANDPRNPSCVADAIADLTEQVARIADELARANGHRHADRIERHAL